MTRNLAILLLGILLIFAPKLLPPTAASLVVPKGQFGLVVIDVGAEGDVIAGDRIDRAAGGKAKHRVKKLLDRLFQKSA